MSEHLQTRTEHSRSLEDAEKYRALETLKQLGFLIPLADIDAYHGRVGHEDEDEWVVDPAFANGGNDSGNSNVNSRPTLYTSDAEVADEFAHSRGTQIINSRIHNKLVAEISDYTLEQKQAWVEAADQRQRDWWDNLPPESKKMYPNGPKAHTFEDLIPGSEAMRQRRAASPEELTAMWQAAAEGLQKQMHEIVAADSDATIIDKRFNVEELSAEDKKRFYQALKGLRVVATEGAPLDFDNRDSFEPLFKNLAHQDLGWISSEAVDKAADETGTFKTAAIQLAAAINAMRIASVSPLYLLEKMLNTSDGIITDEVQVGTDEKVTMPISLEYFEKWLREAHIVGLKQKISSATIGRDIVSFSLFDLSKVNTKGAHEKKREQTNKKLGAIAKSLENSVGNESPLLNLLEDAHAKPRALVDAASEVEGFSDIFGADAGNWEGFTLAEHTETVLHNFDENYADSLPVSMLAPMRLAILAHDIGKPIAAREGERQNQKQYNIEYAAEFYDKLGIDPKLKDLMIAVIGEGAQLAFKIDVLKKGQPAEFAMTELAQDTLVDFYDTAEITQGQIDGFVEMCKILQVCDGGAYTTMAVTRSRQGKGRYRNAPSFQNSFEQPVALGRRDIRLKK
jgi:hypothetical protein